MHRRPAHAVPRRTRPAPARRWTAGAIVTTVLVTATACTPGPPGPEPTVEDLAEALTARDVTQVPFTEADPAAATESVRAAVEGMGEQPHTVTAGDVEVDREAGTATATLEHRWDLDGLEEDWTYTTPVTLDLVEDAWQVRWSPALVAPDLAPFETLRTVRVPAERAEVLDGHGDPVVVPRAVLRLGVDKTWATAEEWDASARALAELLELDPDPYADRVAAAGEKAFVEAIVVRAEDPGVDLDAVSAITGARAVEDELPLAPTRTFARPVLGTAGEATAEIVEESDGAVAPGEWAGLSGLQRQYDAQLRGTPGVTVLAEQGETQRELHVVEPVAGTPLRLTLVPELQVLAEQVLEPVEPASALVAIRPSTGEVLAVASGPGSAGYSTATLATAAPGSVFKVVSGLALLRAGLTTDSEVTCPPSVEVEGRTFTNFPDYPSSATGTVSLATAFAHSCNTAFIGLRDQASPDALAAAAAALGMGGEPDLGYPAFLGAVPTDSTGTDHAASMMGQARVQASPLAMATVAASVAAGRTVVPWLVGEAPPEVAAPSAPLTAQEAEQLATLMRGVVTDGGAGFLEDLPGEPVLAKTGTAEVGDGEDRHNHTWMIAAQGDLAVAVFVERGEYGSTTSGPLLEQFLRAAP